MLCWVSRSTFKICGCLWSRLCVWLEGGNFHHEIRIPCKHKKTKEPSHRRPGYMNFIIPLDKFQAITQNVFIASWHAKRIFYVLFYTSSTLDDKHQLKKSSLFITTRKMPFLYSFSPFFVGPERRKMGSLWGVIGTREGKHTQVYKCVLLLIMVSF